MVDAPALSPEVAVAARSGNAARSIIGDARVAHLAVVLDLDHLLDTRLGLENGIVLLHTSAAEDCDEEGEDEAQDVPIGTQHGALRFAARCNTATSLDESLRQKERREGGPELLSGK